MDTTDPVDPTGTGTAVGDLPPRLAEFQREVDQLKLTGGRANPERTATLAAMVLFVVAVIIVVVAYSRSNNAQDPREQTDSIILALLGVVVALGAVGLYVRNAMTRWFRYWLVRLIYEDRAQTDRIVDAIERTPR
jgi:hypothetical protein